MPSGERSRRAVACLARATEARKRLDLVLARERALAMLDPVELSVIEQVRFELARKNLRRHAQDLREASARLLGSAEILTKPPVYRRKPLTGEGLS